MSGIGSVSFPQVQVPNYSGLGAVYTSGMNNYVAPSQALAQGLQAGIQIGNQRSQLTMQQQDQAMRQQAMKMEMFQKQKEMISNTAFGITQLPEDKQKDAYNQAAISMVQQGIMPANQFPNWDKGGKDMVAQVASQSPMFAEMAKQKMANEKTSADIDLLRARTDVEKAKLIPGMQQQKPLSAESAKMVGLTETGMKGIEDMRSLLQTADTGDLASGTFLPTILQGQKAQDFDRLRTSVSETLGRMNSGGAINKDEEARFMKMMPKWSDSAETKAAKLDQLTAQINTVHDKILGAQGKMTPEDAGFAAASQQYPGLTQSQYQALMSKKAQRQG